ASGCGQGQSALAGGGSANLNREMNLSTVVCVHDDRSNCLTGVKLSVLSLRDKCPHLSILVSCPDPPRSFVEWLDSVSDVRLIRLPETKNQSWNIKPTVLIRLLQEGFGEVIWVDSDIVVHHDVITQLVDQSEEMLCATQETYWGQRQG